MDGGGLRWDGSAHHLTQHKYDKGKHEREQAKSEAGSLAGSQNAEAAAEAEAAEAAAGSERGSEAAAGSERGSEAGSDAASEYIDVEREFVFEGLVGYDALISDDDDLREAKQLARAQPEGGVVSMHVQLSGVIEAASTSTRRRPHSRARAPLGDLGAVRAQQLHALHAHAADPAQRLRALEQLRRAEGLAPVRSERAGPPSRAEAAVTHLEEVRRRKAEQLKKLSTGALPSRLVSSRLDALRPSPSLRPRSPIARLLRLACAACQL